MKILFSALCGPHSLNKPVWLVGLCFFLSTLTHNVLAQDAAPGFDIFEYRVEGNSKLSDDAIEQAIAPFMGEQKTFQDVSGAREQLERVYHEAGYLSVIVTIPEQKIENGVVALLVHEVPVERLRVTGSQYHLPSTIKEQVPELAEGNVPNFPEMQRELANVNRSADLKTTPILRAGQAPGTIEAQLDIEDHLPLHGNVELSNRQSPNTTPERLAGSIHYDNLFQMGHSLGLSAQLSPQKTDEVKVLSATYLAPVGDSGDALTFYGVRSRSSLTTIANSPGLGVLGNTDILGARYALPLTGLEGYSHNLSAGLDWKRVNQAVKTATGSTETPISYVPLVASYTGNILSEERPTTIEATLTMGVRGLFGNRDTEFLAKRSINGSANYFVLRSDVQHTETFHKWSAFAKLEFQSASGPLVSNEQFTAGGAESVRGYLEGELAGDDAVHGTLELRTPEFKPAGANSLWSMTGVGFYDGATLHTSFAQSPQLTNQSIHSAGVGLTAIAPHGFTFQLYWAHAFDTAQITKAGSSRLQAHLEWDY